MNEINEEPKTVKELVDLIIDSMDELDYEFVKQYPSSSIHHTNGRYVRNKHNLWDKNSPIVQDAIKNYNIAHADDISGLIYEWVWAICQNEQFDPILHCDIYHKHWKNLDMTSLEAGGINE